MPVIAIVQVIRKVTRLMHDSSETNDYREIANMTRVVL